MGSSLFAGIWLAMICHDKPANIFLLINAYDFPYDWDIWLYQPGWNEKGKMVG